MNYLIDEAQACGNGANSIVSMVHHYLQHYTCGEENIHLHADNCIDQNKNNTMVSYLAWRVIVGLNKSCELSFMLPGHTQFSPDRFFGLTKRKYRRTKVSSLVEIREVVETSTTGGQNKAFVIGAEDPSKPFHYYNWSVFLSTFFTHVPLITSYHHFRCTQDHRGALFVREFANTEEKVVILKANATVDKTALPAIMIPSGLSEERQQYLYEQIRPFYDEEYRDVTCPEPRALKRPRSQEQSADTQGPSVKRSKRLCSYCRMSGHTKTKKGQITCPKLLQEGSQ